MNANTAIIEIGQFSVESSQLGTRAGGFEAKHEDEEVLVDRRVEILAKTQRSITMTKQGDEEEDQVMGGAGEEKCGAKVKHSAHPATQNKKIVDHDGNTSEIDE